MYKKFVFSVFILSLQLCVYSQNNNDTIRDTVRFINPNPDLFREEFIICKPAKVFLFYDTPAKEMVYLRRNFTDQFLQVCDSRKILPASNIWGFNLDNKYFRSGHTFNRNYVFAERIATGKMSLFYCRNMPNTFGEIELMSTDPKHPDYTNRMIIEDPDSKRYKNDFSYFISPWADSAKMILVNNKNVGDVAKQYLKDSPEAYKDAMHYVQRNRLWEGITLTTAVTAYAISLLNFGGTGLTPFNYENPLLYVSLASLGTYIYLRVKGKNRYLSPNDMIRIISKYNGQTIQYKN
jgi:hypothetical protein